MIDIAMAYVSDDNHQYYQELSVSVGTTIYQALLSSGWLDLPDFAQFRAWCDDNLANTPNHKAWYVGIYGQKQPLNAIVSQGDRIEIYRPLSYDPMARRKQKSKSVIKSKSAKV